MKKIISPKIININGFTRAVSATIDTDKKIVVGICNKTIYSWKYAEDTYPIIIKGAQDATNALYTRLYVLKRLEEEGIKIDPLFIYREVILDGITFRITDTGYVRWHENGELLAWMPKKFTDAIVCNKGYRTGASCKASADKARNALNNIGITLKSHLTQLFKNIADGQDILYGIDPSVEYIAPSIDIEAIETKPATIEQPIQPIIEEPVVKESIKTQIIHSDTFGTFDVSSYVNSSKEKPKSSGRRKNKHLG